MSIYKDNVTGKWRVVYRYTDWTGKTKQTSKRGFPTKREAQMWEHEQMLKHDAKLDMTFASFYEIYVEDKKERIRDNTWGTKKNIARTKILPYFGERKIAEIEPKDVIAWQNHLLAFKRANGKGYSASYLRKIHSQLSAIFNHAVDFYHLPSNPAQKAGNIAIDLNLKGESVSIVTACASSTHSIGEAYRTIKYGAEDVILAGGTESSICEVGIAGFENMKALSKSEDKNRASIPFDKQRDGFVMGEGAGVIVLEELEHAKKRGAKIYAEIIGYGATSDAYHITSPEPTGDGAARAIKRAIEDANIKPEDIDYINAHGTSTHLNDVCETMAIKKALGEDVSKKVMVSSTKGNTGHLLGAAGAIEAIFSIKAIENKIVPPTINYKEKDEECDLDIVPNEIRKKDLKIVMSNSLGFGGHNGSVIFKEYEE